MTKNTNTTFPNPMENGKFDTNIVKCRLDGAAPTGQNIAMKTNRHSALSIQNAFNSHPNIPIFLGVATSAAAIYLYTLTFDFVWDDIYLILQDHTIKSLKYLSVIFSSDFFGHQEDDLVYGYFRPMTTLTYLFDFAFWQQNPFGFHLTNVILHTIATLLAAAVLLNLTQNRFVSFIAALLFAIHPIHTENVAWISGRTDIVAFNLAMTALLLHLKGGAGGRWSLLYRISAPLLFVAALLAKEMAVVLIPWIAVIQYDSSKRKPLKRLIGPLLPYIGGLFFYLIWRFFIVNVTVPAPHADITVLDKILMMPWTVIRYLAWLILPIAQSAYVKNPYLSGPLDIRLYIGIFGVLGIVFLLRRVRQNHLLIRFSWMLGASFLPILNIISISGPQDMGFVMAERFLYFPSYLFFAIVAMGLSALFQRFQSRKPAIILIFSIIVSLGAATLHQSAVWKNNEIFYTKTLERVQSALLLCNLANHYIIKGRFAEADQALKKAKKYFSNDYHYMAVKASYLVAQRQYKEALKLQRRIAQKVKRGRAVAYNNLAFLYRATGDLTRAEQLLKEIIHNNRAYGDVYFNLAEVYRAQRHFDKAEQFYEQALKQRPDNIQYAGAFGNMLASNQKLEKSAGVFEQQRKMYPTDPGILNNLGVIYRKMGKETLARTRFETAVKHHPSYPKARLNLADIYLVLGHTELAMRHLIHLTTHFPNTPEGRQAKIIKKRILEGRTK